MASLIKVVLSLRHVRFHLSCIERLNPLIQTNTVPIRIVSERMP
jgi:hypothetical protein